MTAFPTPGVLSPGAPPHAPPPFIPYPASGRLGTMGRALGLKLVFRRTLCSNPLPTVLPVPLFNAIYCFSPRPPQHFSFFCFLFLPFYRLGVLEPTLFVVHVAATHLTFWAVWDLSLTLFGDPLAGLLTVLALIFPHIGFSSFPIFEFSLLNRTFVLPFLLWAMTLFLRGRHVWAFALLGVLYNLHVLSVNFVLCMFLLAAALDFRRIGWRCIGLGLGVFGLGAFPLLSWGFSRP